jgi:FdhE protein
VIEQTLARLDQLAQHDPTVAPLARLQAEALRASADAAWDEGVPELTASRAEDGVPLLHGQTLRVDLDRAQRLLVRLARLTGQTEAQRATARAVDAASFQHGALLQAIIVGDGETLERLAAECGAEPALLATLGQLAALPLLWACGRRAAPLVSESGWQHGYCPVCAAWPTLAELRGLERTRWLRCGRCGSGWSFHQATCPFCGVSDRRANGYLAPEQAREARRAMTCDACQRYLKTMTTFGAMPPAEIGLMDAQTIELDVAALEHGYGQPDGPGFPLSVSVELTERRSIWRPWRR